ncbi:MAG: rhodanese-like domain-containing protein [Holophagales bacterium]|nr:rhodanese-like domain-containing protein [Holophagales bacterium]MXX63119.1 rhodanese-like domain-containing protein [Holophagales bacterium]MYC08848.1 rhodanese-like domain-containing protein [Holophagales bacterium]MYD21021.1 rhodanese-like domain-containing protein [Holophagales bacterium]MYI33219.1 rhodanese-like domain-containing protein [Holophagales bacterium]
MTRGVRQLVAEADDAVETVTVAAALERQQAGALIVDLRDIRERAREGFIPGSFHAPRGMIEFWVDPDSPYFKDVFGGNREFIFHCASGWRSALATKAVQDMGLAPVSHVGGGFTAWKKADAPVLRTDDGREPRA